VSHYGINRYLVARFAADGLKGVETLYIEPGSPWENGYAESFNSRFRDELLAREEWENLPEARTYGTRYRLEYNHRRPHSRTPGFNPLPVSQTQLS
jgi:transposase InsO family protein